MISKIFKISAMGSLFALSTFLFFLENAYASYNYEQDEIRRKFAEMREQERNLQIDQPRGGQGIPKYVDKAFSQLDDPIAEAKVKAELQQMKGSTKK